MLVDVYTVCIAAKVLRPYVNLWPLALELYIVGFLTLAENSSVLGVPAVVLVEALVWTVNEPLLGPSALHVVQENGSISLAVESPRRSNRSFKHVY